MQGLDLIYSTLKLLKMIYDDPMSNGAKLLPSDLLPEGADPRSDSRFDFAYVNHMENVILGPATVKQLKDAIKECEKVSVKFSEIASEAGLGDGPDTELFLERVNAELKAMAIPQETVDNLAE